MGSARKEVFSSLKHGRRVIVTESQLRPSAGVLCPRRRPARPSTSIRPGLIPQRVPELTNCEACHGRHGHRIIEMENLFIFNILLRRAKWTKPPARPGPEPPAAVTHRHEVATAPQLRGSSASARSTDLRRPPPPLLPPRARAASTVTGTADLPGPAAVQVAAAAANDTVTVTTVAAAAARAACQCQ